MASIDKIYALKEQRQEFLLWCEKNKPEAARYFYEWYSPDWDDGLEILNKDYELRIELLEARIKGLQNTIRELRNDVAVKRPGEYVVFPDWWQNNFGGIQATVGEVVGFLLEHLGVDVRYVGEHFELQKKKAKTREK